MRRHCILLLLALVPGLALAAQVALIGVIGNKAAVLALDGGEPKTVKVGQHWNGITVLSVEKDRALVEMEGTKRVLHIGQHYRGAAPSSGRESVTLAAGAHGQFVTEGAINGVPVRFMVDTGASVVALSPREASRLGIDYRNGQPVSLRTANGTAVGHLVTLDRVRVGTIELTGVEAVVGAQEMEIALLGMSFLNRLEMKRDGERLTLTRRF